MGVTQTKTLVALCLIVLTMSPLAKAFRISMTNYMGPGIDLLVLCASPTTKLKEAPVLPSGTFSWDFDVKGAHWECEMSSVAGKRHGIFVVFNENPDAARCGGQECKWEIRLDGGYLYLPASSSFVKEITWPSP